MRKVVSDLFFDYNVQHEGYTPFMYCDDLNLVTSGVGDLIDRGPNHPGATTAERARLNNVVSPAAMAPALLLPWKLRGPGWTSKNPVSGAAVSTAEIVDAWTKVKRQNEIVPDFSQRGGFAYAPLTNLTLSIDDIRALFKSTMLSFESTIKTHLPNWEQTPADAQFGTMSMAWAMGPEFPVTFTAWRQAFIANRFRDCAAQSFFKGGGALTDASSRNAQDKIMFTNAAMVVEGGTDPNQLYFPGAPPTSGTLQLPLIGSRLPLEKAAIATAGLLATAAAGVGAWEWWKGRKR